ncbi:MAG: hypothetical protein CFH08_02322 [Alphaproteobacteria bacterium MarineAlpha3_Bin7]|nr:MAG: hypothetical protein CFH08_02322 [Alphaproteobacteria bacterium MarineAlpha3_Bin7]|tara:strand:- start:667 stop:1245 length:579 start_codon:yes stop_codon:yes gene_type:complete
MKLRSRIGWLLLVGAFISAAAESAARGLLGESGNIVILGAGDVLSAVAPKFYVGLKTFITTRLHTILWDPVSQTILLFPGWFLLGIPGSILVWSSYAGKKNESESEEEEPYTSYEEIITSLEKLERKETIVENPKYRSLDDYDPLYPPRDSNSQSETNSYPVGSSDTANFNQDDWTEDKEANIDRKQSKEEY